MILPALPWAVTGLAHAPRWIYTSERACLLACLLASHLASYSQPASQLVVVVVVLVVVVVVVMVVVVVVVVMTFFSKTSHANYCKTPCLSTPLLIQYLFHVHSTAPIWKHH